MKNESPRYQIMQMHHNEKGSVIVKFDPVKGQTWTLNSAGKKWEKVS